MTKAIDLAGPLEGLRYEKQGPVALITLDRPARANALLPSMQPLFRALWADVREDPEVRVAVVTASGDRHFCTGVDVTAVAEQGSVGGDGPLSEAVHWSPHQNRVWKPVVCAVNGLANGAGLHFVVDADIVVAAEHAAFMDSHVNVGMVGAVENIGLARRLPIGAALRMTLMGRAYRMPAARAYQLGLVDELVPGPDLLDTALGIAREIARNSPHAVSLSKQAIWASQEMGYRDALEYGWALLRLHWRHPDFVEGPRAFAEKREPRWTVTGTPAAGRGGAPGD